MNGVFVKCGSCNGFILLEVPGDVSKKEYASRNWSFAGWTSKPDGKTVKIACPECNRIKEAA